MKLNQEHVEFIKQASSQGKPIVQIKQLIKLNYNIDITERQIANYLAKMGGVKNLKQVVASTILPDDLKKAKQILENQLDLYLMAQNHLMKLRPEEMLENTNNLQKLASVIPQLITALSKSGGIEKPSNNDVDNMSSIMEKALEEIE